MSAARRSRARWACRRRRRASCCSPTAAAAAGTARATASSPRVLREAGLATLLVDLLTRRRGGRGRSYTAHLRFDIGLLADRLVGATDWLGAQRRTAGCRSATSGPAPAAGRPWWRRPRGPARCGAVVSRGGRPDLAGAGPAACAAPTLLIVGGDDEPVHRPEPAGPRPARAAERGAGDRPRGVAPVRGAGDAGGGRPAGADWFSRHLADADARTGG